MIRPHRALLPALILIASAWNNQARATDIAGLQLMYDGAVLPDVSVATLSHTERLLPVLIGADRYSRYQGVPSHFRIYISAIMDTLLLGDQ